MVRSRQAVQVLLLMGIIASCAFAGPIAYSINFTTTSGSPPPTSGSFTYDGAAALGSQFAAFDVLWDGLTFDLTSSANTGGQGSGCGVVTSSTIFQVLQGTAECPGSNTFGWFGGHGSLNSEFAFGDTGASSDFIQVIGLNPATGTGGASGTFSITAINGAPTPEPSSFILALVGGAFLVRKRMHLTTRRSSQTSSPLFARLQAERR